MAFNVQEEAIIYEKNRTRIYIRSRAFERNFTLSTPHVLYLYVFLTLMPYIKHFCRINFTTAELYYNTNEINFYLYQNAFACVRSALIKSPALYRAAEFHIRTCTHTHIFKFNYIYISPKIKPDQV